MRESLISLSMYFITKKIDKGGDITKYLDVSKRYRPEQEQKRVNVDFPDHAAGFADAVPNEATDGAIDFLAFVLGQAKRVENDFIQFGAVRQWLK
ncbi:MAG: hypothetical protein PHW12_04300 [Smithella sp.]|nr:hypothetical protein [Smithella sp.]